MKKLKLILPIAGASMLATTSGALTACSCGHNTEVIEWPGNFIGIGTWTVMSDDAVQIKSGCKYSINFDWSDTGTQLRDGVDDSVELLLINTGSDETFDFTGSSYKLEAFNTNTNVWDTINDLEPQFKDGAHRLYVEAEEGGDKPWLPLYYKKGCRFIFTAQKSSETKLQFGIGIKDQ